MLNVRHGVFETNSSSTHSITVCSKSQYDEWARGDVYFNDCWYGGKDKFITKGEAIELLSKYNNVDIDDVSDEELNEMLAEERIYTYNNYGDEYLEQYEERYTSESGDDIVIFGEYGHD